MAIHSAVSATSNFQLRNSLLPCDCFVPCIVICRCEKAKVGLRLNGWPERNPILKEEKIYAAGIQALLTFVLSWSYGFRGTEQVHIGSTPYISGSD